MYAIEIDNVSKKFPSNGQNDSTIDALHEVCISVKESEFITILGPSGCGKTTLLMIIAGFTTATNGRVRFWGSDIRGPSPDRTMVFQEYALFPWMTLAQNIAFGLKSKRLENNEMNCLIREYLEMVNLSEFANRYPHQVSGGMKQRVSIARALAPDPGVVIMDEPFGSLDAFTREQMQEELLAIQAKTNKTMILVTHSIEEAVFLSDRVYIMSPRPGSIVEVLDINLPRPRNALLRSQDKKFIEFRNHLYETLRSITWNKDESLQHSKWTS